MHIACMPTLLPTNTATAVIAVKARQNSTIVNIHTYTHYVKYYTMYTIVYCMKYCTMQ